MSELHAIIMAGGSGSRFWPASRADRPKQFLPLVRGETLIRTTVDRAAGAVGMENTWIVTHPVLAAALPDVLGDFPAERVIVEPEPRDTAPCVALASATVEAKVPGATMAFLPADQLIEPQEDFTAILRRAADLAAGGNSLVTFGIPPTHPATTYGYIERAGARDEKQPAAFSVAQFREKPDLETAQQFLQSGSFLWNSGMFLWTFDALLQSMRAGNPELAESTCSILAAVQSGDRDALDREFRSCPKTSVDYAVMEQASEVVVVQMDLSWEDLGSFTTLGSVSPSDAQHNVTSLHDGARAIVEDASDCVVYGEGPRAIALFGVRDLVVVSMGDSVLVCAKDRADELKAMATRLRSEGMEDLL